MTMHQRFFAMKWGAIVRDEEMIQQLRFIPGFYSARKVYKDGRAYVEVYARGGRRHMTISEVAALRPVYVSYGAVAVNDVSQPLITTWLKA